MMDNLKRYCTNCQKIVPHDHICPNKQKPSPKKTTEADSYRWTTQWAKLSRQIRERDHYLCQLCLSAHFINSEGLSVHHITPIKEDPSLAYEEENLITLCSACHHKVEQDWKKWRPKLEELAKQTTAEKYEADEWVLK